MTTIVRVARDGNAVIVKDAGKYTLLSRHSGAEQSSDELRPLVASGSWRQPIEKDWATFGDILMKEKKIDFGRIDPSILSRKMRVPATILFSLSSMAQDTEIVAFDKIRLRRIAETKVATIEDIFWLSDVLEKSQTALRTLDDRNVHDWTARTLSKNSITASAFVPSDTLAYFAAGPEENSSLVSQLLAVPNDDENVLLSWTGEKFVPLPIATSEFESPTIVEIDAETAKALANWITDGSEGDSFDIAGLNPEERNLSDLAFSEIDWDHIDQLQSILADASGYSPIERSENARRQQRGGNGRFAGDQAERNDQMTAFAKARLSTPKDVIINPAQRIETYMAEVAAKQQPASPVIAAGMRTDIQPLYMAVVDPVDREAVLDVVAIVPTEDGNPSAWTRSNGDWTNSPEVLADLQGVTPPPVVELTDEEEVKNLLVQVDQYDAETETLTASAHMEMRFWEATDYSKNTREKYSKKGWALPDGSYPIANISDLKNAIKAYGRTSEGKRAAVKRHIKKRAKALGRTNLLPEDWKEASVSSNDVYKTTWELPNNQQDMRDFSVRKGLSLPDGSFPIHNDLDLTLAIQASGLVSEERMPYVRTHIRKRAKALNRTDLVPEAWDASVLSDLSVLFENSSPLYGPTGEVIIAAGIPGVADTPEDFQAVRRLKNYWLYGAGGAKINWANPKGNMTRCIRYLSKYMPGRAGGYCQELHKEFYGATNAKVDKAAGI